MARGLPVVAVVGRPNVGKSSLVNRVLGRREAIVQETPGVTRDRRGFVAEWGGRAFEIVDTGGLEPGQEGLDAQVAEQARLAMDTADVIVLVTDNSTGPTEDDAVVARLLRGSRQPVVLAVNKVDDPRDEPAAADFYRLGLGEPVPVSALHGRGSGDLLEVIGAHLPQVLEEVAGDWAAAAIVGRPNVGKSSLLNALVGDSRALVDATPGTTRDPVDDVIELVGDRRIRLIDTAGMRKQTRIDDPIEYFSWLRSRRTLERVDVALLVVDAASGATGHDQRIGEAIVEAGRACVIAYNKWDLMPSEEADRKRAEAHNAERLRFLPWAGVVRTVATTGRGVDRLLPALSDAVEAHRTQLRTSDLNDAIHELQERRPHPRVGGRLHRILYAAQAGVGPPRILLFSNASLEPTYLRYLERGLRERAGLTGTPLKLEVRAKTRR